MEDLIRLSDTELIHAYKKRGNMQIISILMDRYKDPIVGMATRYLKDEEAVKDFTSDLFLKLSIKLRESEIRNLKSWIQTLVMNRLRDQSRKQKVRALYKEGLKEGVEQMEGKVNKKMDYVILDRVINILNDKEQACVRLIYFEEKSYQEIMKQQAWSFNQVRGIRDRAIKKLKQTLGTEFQEYFAQ